jgi:hypothetical protein
MIEIKDIFDSLPDDQRTEDVISALRVAYYRGVENHKADPIRTEEIQKKRIDRALANAL